MVKVYDNVIPSKACKNFIDLFENNENHQEYIDYNGCPCFTQLNLNQLSPNIVRSLIPYLAQVYKQYKNDIRSKYTPRLKELEELQRKIGYLKQEVSLTNTIINMIKTEKVYDIQENMIEKDKVIKLPERDKNDKK